MTGSPDVALAPGCFGSPLIYAETNAICGGCMFSAACQPKAVDRLAVLHAHFGIKPKAAKVAPALPVKQNDAPVTAKVAAKVDSLQKQMDRQSTGALLSLRQGVNPIVRKENSARRLDVWMAFEFFRRGHVVSRDLLRDAYVARFNWRPEYASAQSAKTLASLVALGLVIKKDSLYSVRAE